MRERFGGGDDELRYGNLEGLRDSCRPDVSGLGKPNHHTYHLHAISHPILN